MPPRAGDTARRGGAPQSGEIYLEYRRVGAQLHVAAIDPVTGIEVTMFGPANVSQEELGRLAVRKLERRLAAENKTRPARPNDPTLV